MEREEYACPKCEGKMRNNGYFGPRYFKLKDGRELGYIYHEIVDNQGRLKQHSTGMHAPPRRLEVSRNERIHFLTREDKEVLNGLYERCKNNKENVRADVIEKILARTP